MSKLNLVNALEEDSVSEETAAEGAIPYESFPSPTRIRGRVIEAVCGKGGENSPRKIRVLVNPESHEVIPVLKSRRGN